MTTTQREASEWAIGVDVGGTKVAVGVVDARGEIHQHTRVQMRRCHALHVPWRVRIIS